MLSLAEDSLFDPKNGLSSVEESKNDPQNKLSADEESKNTPQNKLSSVKASVFDIRGIASAAEDGMPDVRGMKISGLANAPRIARAWRGLYPAALPCVAPEQRLMRRAFDVRREGRTERQFPRPVLSESVGK
jgi:hypothetical protein